MKMRKIIAMFSVAAMVAMTAVGCGGSDDTTTDGEATEEASGEEWDSTMDITVVSREDGSGTRGAFVELMGVMEDDEDMTTVDAQISNSTSVVMTTVAGDEYGIGYISLGSLDDSVKAVTVDGVEATSENVLSGDYAVARPFNIAVKEDADNAAADDFIKFIMSTEGQVVVEENGFIPLTDVAAYEPATVSGKVVVGGSTSVSPVMEKLMEAYNEINAEVEFELQPSGSSAGMEQAAAGTYDIGMASREVKDSEIESGLVPTVIAQDGIAVVVNNTSTVEDLTAEQIKSIYLGDVTTWDEVMN